MANRASGDENVFGIGSRPEWKLSDSRVLSGALDLHAPGVHAERLDVDGIVGLVAVWTRHPELLIGRRGVTADSIRQSIVEAF